jgi:Cell wall-active antibiotics response 4TMS YvqF/Domain of unknown function (DUF5668)
MPTNRRFFTPNVVTGFGLAFLGVALLLDRLLVVDAWEVLKYWPLLLILFGLSIAVQAVQGPLPPDMKPEANVISAPLVLVVIIFALLGTSASRRSEVKADGSDRVSISAILGGNQHVSHSTAFRSASLMSVMGGSKLDLRQAKIAPGTEAVVDVFTVMGGVELLVPKDWNVDIQLVPIMGGVNDERYRTERNARTSRRERDRRGDDDVPPVPPPPAPDASAAPDRSTVAVPEPVEPDAPVVLPADAPRLVVRGFIMMGGLVVKQ